ncbi:hypothetical protein ABZ383_28695 [Streptomyces sp. NPDC005900]|uniref:hypothetical protein n=1 Tax=Streptomyces sp. NPDC005900 TaxID=3154569 RepID=UPI003401178F
MGFRRLFAWGSRDGDQEPPEIDQNVVGALVYVRRAARSTFEWSRKPPSRTFAVAHHEVGEADLTARVRKALDQLALLDG